MAKKKDIFGIPIPELPEEFTKPKADISKGGGYSYIDPATGKGYEVSPTGVKTPVIPKITAIPKPTMAMQEQEGMDWLKARESKAAKKIAQGMAPREAEREAMKELAREAEAGQIPMTPEEKAKLMGLEEPQFKTIEELTAQQQLIEEQNQPTYAGGIPRFSTTGTLAGDIERFRKYGMPAAIQTAAEVYDAFEKSLFGGRKTGRVQKAEASFVDATNIIKKDIEMVKLGTKPAANAERDFMNAIGAINRLERTTKGLGKINLRFWLDQGAELQTSILNEKIILEDLRNELLAAAAASRLAAAAAYPL